jgi:aminopeptidase N
MKPRLGVAAGLAGWRTALALLGALVWVSAACAQATDRVASAQGKLPKTAVPFHYAIDLVLDLETSTIAGTERIDIEIREPTDRLVLNAVQITIEQAVLEGEPGQIAGVTFDADEQTATLTFPRALAIGPHKLRIAFAGRINSYGRGLFRVDYPTANGRKRMMATHLEPADARRIFPSWDEPAFKASFTTSVTVPEAFLAVSNMPVAREEKLAQGLKRVTFAPTPRMSSYLFVLVAGELERQAIDVDGVSVGVVTTLGKSGQGRYALDSAAALLRYFNDYFGVPYALPKLDLIAVPGGYGGAMENWGGITFYESRLLFDPATSPGGARRSIFAILAHEMAHQWFGDLVTMAWWDDLWLNEGLASWMEAKAGDALNPDWQVWLNNSGAKQWAMGQDARRTTRPIQVPIKDESEAMAIFDGITYSKGQAFMRQLEAYLGEDVFRDGIRRYMKDHAYSNTTTADLWAALQAASGKPVAEIAARYTEQAGVPLIVSTASCAGGQQRLALRQERFTVNDPREHREQWSIPVTIGPVGAAEPSGTVLLQERMAEIEAGRCGAPVKLNLGNVGYYRVQYDEATQAAFAKSFATLAPADRINLLADTWALVEGARIAFTRYFELLEAVPSDDDRAVWEQAIRPLGYLDYLERRGPDRLLWQAYARARLRPVFDNLGWDGAANEPADRGLLRARVIRSLGDFGDEQILAEARRRFAAFVKDPATLRPGLRDPVLHLAGRTADRATFDTIHALARATTSTEERSRYYFALASATDPALARDTLAIALTDELPSTLVGSVISWVASAGEHPDLAWTFVKTNFATLVAKQGPGFRDYFVPALMTNFSDSTRANELASFKPVQETSGGRMSSARAEEEIRANANFAEKILPAIESWLKARPARP